MRKMIKFINALLLSAVLFMLFTSRLFVYNIEKRNNWNEEYRKEIQQLLKRSFRTTAIPKTTQKSLRDVFLPFNDDNVHIRKLKELREFIHTTLDKIQNEGNCDDKKLIRCHNSVLSGFGSTIHRHVICLHIAFALNRAFIIDHDYKDFDGLASFTMLESGKCGGLRKMLRKVKEEEKCNFKDSKCYKDKYNFEINNDYKLLEFTAEAAFPAPKYIPGTVPKNIQQALEEIGVKRPWHWFTAQLLGYMILRPKQEFLKKMTRLKRELHLENPLVGMHIRRGDKIGSEAHLIDEKDFYNAAMEWSKNKTKKDEITTLYIASGDRGVVRKILKIADKSKFRVVGSPTLTSSNILRKREDSKKETMENILIDLYVLLHCDYAIVTFSSNIGRLLWELKTSLFPYSNAQNIKSMDHKLYYGWYDYNAREVYYLAKTDVTEIVTVDKLELTKIDKGKLYHAGGRRSIKLKNGTRIEVVKVRPRHGTPGWKGYARLEVFELWPGQPHYINDVRL